MKKNIKITTTILAVLTAFLFTSCFDPIYSVIRTDVKPEKATINGSINSIARFDDKLVLAANGGLKYKPANAGYHGAWDTYGGLPFDTAHSDRDSEDIQGKMIVKVVSDATNIYLVTVSFNGNTPTNPEIWAGTLNGGWKNLGIEGLSLGKNEYGRSTANFNVFGNNAETEGNRKAYLRIGEDSSAKYYDLSDPKTVITSTPPKAVDQEGKSINSVVNFNGKDVFFNSVAATANDKFIYYGNGEDLMYTKDGTNPQKAFSAGDPIASLAVTSDSIIIGCGDATTGATGGIKRATLDSKTKKPGSGVVGFTTNAQFQISSAYQVPCVFNATPNESETNSQLYAAITFPGIPTGNTRYSSRGLWSYYPGRGNWNRE